jgi:putative sterol carrier protein
MSTTQGFNPDTISAEEFSRLVGSMGEAQLTDAIHGIGTGRVLDRVFAQFSARFRPEHATGVDAESQFVIRDGTEEHPYVVGIRGGRCEVRPERSAEPRVTLVAELLPFVKLVTGHAEGANLFMTGKLRVAGDLVFALRLLSFFDRPKPV